MSKLKAKQSTLAGLIDSDGDEDQLVAELLSPVASPENRAPITKGRGKAKVAAKSSHAPSKVSKAKPAARRLSGRLNGKSGAGANAKESRQALADKTNLQDASDVDDGTDGDIEMGDELMEESIVSAKKPGRKAAATKSIGAKKGPKSSAKSTQIPDAKKAQRVASTAKKGRPTKVNATIEKVVPETQLEEEMSVDVEEEVDETLEHPVRNKSGQQSKSTSMTEPGDSELRRSLEDLRRKLDGMTAKYEKLRDIGVKEAEQNFNNFQRQSEEKSRVQTELIASIKEDLAYQTSLTKDSKAHKKKIESQKLEIASFQVQIAELKASLAEAQSHDKTLVAENKNLATEIKALTVEKQALAAENKMISTKLAANRTAAASVESVNTKVPGSAAKLNGGIRMVGTAEAAQLAQAAQLKEDIYSDLTGLIIQGVKREPEEDIFNCLQTGRNGTLHFKLAASNDKAAESYDEAQCSYVPQLDPSRDRALMELLPDYLVDEITFPRPQAAKFYARVVRALTEKL